MKVSTKNSSFFIIVLFTVAAAKAQALGAVEDVAKYTGKHIDDIARVVTKNTDDLVRVSLRHTDDVLRFGVVHADDIARLSVFHADDIARLALRQGDDIIYDFSKVHLKARVLGKAAGNAEDVALKGLSYSELMTKYDKKVADAFYSYASSDQYKFIQAYLDGKPMVPKSGRGIVNGVTYYGDDYMRAIGREKVDVMDNFVRNQKTSKPITTFQGESMSPADFFNKYGIDVGEKSRAEIVDMLNSHGQYTTPRLSSTSLDQNIARDYALHTGYNGPDAIRIIHTIDVPEGSNAFNLSRMEKYKQQQLLFPSGTNRTMTAIPETIIKDGISYDIIRLLETIIQ